MLSLPLGRNVRNGPDDNRQPSVGSGEKADIRAIDLAVLPARSKRNLARGCLRPVLVRARGGR